MQTITLRLTRHLVLFCLVATAGCDWFAGTGSQPGASSATSGAGVAQDELHPQVRISTTLGDVVVRLDAEHAPLTVENFLAYADEGHYNGTIFHQVVPDFVAIGGGFREDLVERPVRGPVRNEAHNGLKNSRGTIAMARQAEIIDSATSPFFFNLADNGSLDHHGRDASDYGYCVFGQVIGGSEIIEALSHTPVADRGEFQQLPVTPVAIKSVTRLR